MKKNILLFWFYTDNFDRNGCRTGERGTSESIQTMFNMSGEDQLFFNVIVQPPLILFLCINPFYVTGVFR